MDIEKELTEMKKLLSVMSEDILYNTAFLKVILEEIKEAKVARINPANKDKFIADEKTETKRRIEEKFSQLKAKTKTALEK